MMNEHEFEQHLSSALRQILPTFQKSQITQQRSFSIKFGHHNVFIDGKEPGDRAKRGIYDILLQLNDKPIILLELKRPGIILTLEDRDQGISYARLTNPITPVTIITNGISFVVYDTYTKEQINDRLDEHFFIQRLNQAANLAKNEFNRSITTLIENDQRVLFSLINSISTETFVSLTGNVNDVSKPIIEGFTIRRGLLDVFKEEVANKQFIILTGAPFIGKTNFLFQFFNERKTNEGILYINCKDFSYSIFRKLTNHFQKLIGYPIDELKLKDWLLSSFNHESEAKLIVIFDHVQYDIPQSQMADLAELVDLCKMNGNRMIVATDNSNYELLRQNSDRSLNTIIGNSFHEIVLEKFNTDEFFEGNQKMADTYNIGFAWGAEYSSLYRDPRMWRILLSSSIQNKPGENYLGYIKAIPDTHFIRTFNDVFHLQQNTVNDFVKLTEAYIEDAVRLITTSQVSLMAISLAAIREETALKYINESKIERLIKAGVVERRPIKGFQWVLIPKLPELLSGYAVGLLYQRFKDLFKKDFKNTYSDFIKICEYLPHGELVAAKIVMTIGNSGDIDLFSEILNKLLNDKPKLDVSESQKVIGVYIQKLGQVEITIPEGEDQRFLSNGFPYLVLSHILESDIGDGTENHHYVRFKFITDLTSAEYIIRNADRDFFHEGIPTLTLDGLGEFVKSNIGIVEPIVQVLYFNLLKYWDIFEEIFNLAIKKKQYQTLHRMYIAARNVIAMNSGNQEVEVVSHRIVRQYEDIVPEILAYAMATDKDNEQNKKYIENLLRTEFNEGEDETA